MITKVSENLRTNAAVYVCLGDSILGTSKIKPDDFFVLH